MSEDLLLQITEILNNETLAITLLLTLMFFDFGTGIWGAKVKGELITSKRMRMGLSDKFKWLIGVSFGLTMNFLLEYSLIFKAIVMMGCTVEILSIFENFKKMGINLGGFEDEDSN